MSINHNYDNRTSNPLYHIVWGVRFFFSGLRTLVRNPALLSLSMIPMLLTLALLMGLIMGAALIVGWLIGDAVRSELRIAAQALMFALTLVIAYFLYLPVARVLLAPFAEALSRKTRAISSGRAAPKNNQRWARAMWEGLKLVIFQIAVALVALALGLAFPPVGAPVGIAVAIFLGGLDFFDIPLSTRGLRLRNKLGVIWRNKSLALGFGAAAYMMLLIPVINMLALPVGVVGATLLIDALED
ncbi:MAG TPA: EI24 domain-containing protein [Blastocatellia bacterium]|jgi:CysZ protein|nr:EI24 domain-containing protein [Blastocatellia bacterium]